MSRAPINNSSFPYQTVFFENDNWWVYGVVMESECDIIVMFYLCRSYTEIKAEAYTYTKN